MRTPLEQCYNCDRKIGRLEQAHLWQGHIVCDECIKKLSRPGHGYGAPIGLRTGPSRREAAPSTPPPPPGEEETLLSTRQSIRGPLIGVFFLVGLSSLFWGLPALIIGLVLGLPYLLVSYTFRSSQTLTITTRRTVMRNRILGSHTNEVLHDHIRNIQVRQGVFQSLIGTGTVALSSAGQSDMEIVFRHLVRPEKAKRLIDEHRHG